MPASQARGCVFGLATMPPTQPTQPTRERWALTRLEQPPSLQSLSGCGATADPSRQTLGLAGSFARGVAQHPVVGLPL